MEGLWILIGLLIGGAVGFVLAKGRFSAVVATLKTELHSREERLIAMERELTKVEEVRKENNDLNAQIAVLNEKLKAEGEKLEWVEEAEKHLKDAFQALAGSVLKSNADEFLKRAREQLDTLLAKVKGDWSTHKEELKGLVGPLSKSLEELDKQVRELESKREGAYKTLEQHLKDLASAQKDLQISNVELKQALKSPTARGRWGEFQLRRVVELAGMTEHVDFDEQATTDEGRPDMIVYMPNNGILPVDSKAPQMDAFFSAVEAQDDSIRNKYLKELVRTMQQRVKELSGKSYWSHFDHAPEFVVMYVPSEACLSTVFQLDPELFENAARQHVLITSPVTLLAVLRAVAYGWQQHEIAEGAREITAVALELYHRFNNFLAYFQKAGTRLGQAVEAYNKAVGSAVSRLLPSGRKLEGLANEEIQSLSTVDQKPRAIPLPDADSEGVGS